MRLSDNQNICLEVKRYLTELLGNDNVLENELLGRHTTLRIGGPASFFVNVANKENLLELISYLTKNEIRFYILGFGSNILALDEGYDGVIIRLSGDFEEISVNGNEITAGAGIALSIIAKKAYENSLSGFEFASGIPGSLGGALVMNAGAYGGEMVQVVKEVALLEKEGNEYIFKTYSLSEMKFAYRHSIAKEKEVVFLSAVLSLNKGDKEIIKNTMDDMNRSRREKQPLEYPSAGSTFKRPEGYFAGKLISDAGLKGYAVNDACVSEKHAGFCINKGNASSADFQKLMDDVSDKVYELYNVKLEPEVIVLS